MTSSWIGFKMTMPEPVKKFVRDKFYLGNHCLGVTCAKIWGSAIGVTRNISFFTLLKKIKQVNIKE